jgi:hypothetical protein
MNTYAFDNDLRRIGYDPRQIDLIDNAIYYYAAHGMPEPSKDEKGMRKWDEVAKAPPIQDMNDLGKKPDLTKTTTADGTRPISKPQPSSSLDTASKVIFNGVDFLVSYPAVTVSIGATAIFLFATR